MIGNEKNDKCDRIGETGHNAKPNQSANRVVSDYQI